MSKIKSQLLVEGLLLQVHLGVTPQERASAQDVYVTFQFLFSQPVKAQFSDKIEDAIDYDQLGQIVKQHVQQKHYHLIEKLTQDIFDLTKKSFPQDYKLKVCVNKTVPPSSMKEKSMIPSPCYLKNGASFTVGEV